MIMNKEPMKEQVEMIKQKNNKSDKKWIIGATAIVSALLGGVAYKAMDNNYDNVSLDIYKGNSGIKFYNKIKV